MDITLEKVDQVIQRTSVSYKAAKEALEFSEGDVLDAIIFLEERNSLEENFYDDSQERRCSEKADAFKVWLKDIIDKGTVSRIKIKKDDSVLLDIPVNAGIAASVIAITLPPVLGVIAIAIVAGKLSVELTKLDGTVEVLNDFVLDRASNLKDKGIGAMTMATSFIKVKANREEISKSSVINTIKSMGKSKEDTFDEDGKFSYTVNFENID